MVRGPEKIHIVVRIATRSTAHLLPVQGLRNTLVQRAILPLQAAVLTIVRHLLSDLRVISLPPTVILLLEAQIVQPPRLDLLVISRISLQAPIPLLVQHLPTDLWVILPLHQMQGHKILPLPLTLVGPNLLQGRHPRMLLKGPLLMPARPPQCPSRHHVPRPVLRLHTMDNNRQRRPILPVPLHRLYPLRKFRRRYTLVGTYSRGSLLRRQGRELPLQCLVRLLGQDMGEHPPLCPVDKDMCEHHLQCAVRTLDLFHLPVCPSRLWAESRYSSLLQRRSPVHQMLLNHTPPST